MKRCVANAKGAAFANPEQADSLSALTLPDGRDRPSEVVIDVIVHCQPTIGSGRMPPVDHIDIDPGAQEVPYKRTIFLQINDGVTAHKTESDQKRLLDPSFGYRTIPIEHHLIRAPDLVFRSRTNFDILVSNFL